MSIAETLRDIAEESSLNEAERCSLRSIAKEVETMERRLEEFVDREIEKLIT